MKTLHLPKLALLSLAFLAMLAAPLWAAVKGDCVNCHTMHNSQDGQPVKFRDVELQTAMPTLLKTDCVGCHSNPGSSETIYRLGDSQVPSVYNPGGGLQYPANGSSNSVLAGGNFFWVESLGDAYGHNVYGISEPDAVHSGSSGFGAPGGLGPIGDASVECYNCHFTLATPEFGCEGCHLARKAHHADDGDPDGVAERGDGWYRFLGNAMLRNIDLDGVIGVEDPKWEQDPSPTQHNVYKGTVSNYSSTTLNFNSMGQFCAGCHNAFHHGSDENDGMRSASGAWIRHPSDVILPADPEREYSGYTTYNPLAPVAKQTVTAAVNSSVVPGEDLVTCISCHRPHGSPYPDMLRWDYLNDCDAGVEDSAENPCGCFACHTTKDGI